MLQAYWPDVWPAGGATTRTPSSRSWSSSTGAGAPVIGSPPLAVFGNAMTSRIDSRAPSSATIPAIPIAIPPWGARARAGRAADAVDPHRAPAVRRRAVLERVEQEAEAPVGLLLAQPDDLEDLALDLGRVDADRAAAELPAVDDEVVAAREHRAGVLERPLRGRERVVDRGPAAALPRLEHREIGDPEDVVAVGRDQPEAPPELEPQRSERLGRGPFLVGDEQDEVALRPGERAGRRRFLVLGEELRDRRAPAAVLDVRPRDRLAAVAADDVVQTVELRPRHVARARVQRPHRAAVAQHRLEDA